MDHFGGSEAGVWMFSGAEDESDRRFQGTGSGVADREPAKEQCREHLPSHCEKYHRESNFCGPVLEIRDRSTLFMFGSWSDFRFQF